MAQVDLKNCTITFKDGGAEELAIKIGEGNITWTEKRNIEFIKDRGLLDSVREGNKVPLDVSFNIVWEYLSTMSTDTEPKPEECLKKTGEASAWVTTDSDACKPYAIDIEIEDVVGCSGTDDERITLSDFRYETIDHDLKAGVLNVTGKCNISLATVARF